MSLSSSFQNTADLPFFRHEKNEVGTNPTCHAQRHRRQRHVSTSVSSDSRFRFNSMEGTRHDIGKNEASDGQSRLLAGCALHRFNTYPPSRHDHVRRPFSKLRANHESSHESRVQNATSMGKNSSREIFSNHPKAHARRIGIFGIENLDGGPKRHGRQASPTLPNTHRHHCR